MTEQNKTREWYLIREFVALGQMYCGRDGESLMASSPGEAIFKAADRIEHETINNQEADKKVSTPVAERDNYYYTHGQANPDLSFEDFNSAFGRAEAPPLDTQEIERLEAELDKTYGKLETIFGYVPNAYFIRSMPDITSWFDVDDKPIHGDVVERTCVTCNDTGVYIDWIDGKPYACLCESCIDGMTE